eukprot:PhM_4_TR17300/c0_g1_i1/m.12802/K20346/TMED4_9_11; p24 family protein alpha
MSRLLIALFVVCCAILISSPVAVEASFYFRLSPGKRMCFSEEVVTLFDKVIVEYTLRRPAHVQRNDYTTVAEVRAPDQTVISTINLDAAKTTGSFTFRPKKDMLGEYDMCFTMKGEVEYIDLGLSVDSRNRVARVQDPEPHITRQKVSQDGAAMEVMSFLDSDGQPKDTLRSKAFLDRIHGEMSNLQVAISEARVAISAFKAQQERFRQTSESTFERVWVMASITMAVVAMLAMYQYRNLKGFLLKKKLV